MIVLFEIVELVATFIEVFVLYRIYGILFQKYRNYKTEKIDFWIAVAAVCVIRVCNHFSAFSYFAMLLQCIPVLQHGFVIK